MWAPRAGPQQWGAGVGDPDASASRQPRAPGGDGCCQVLRIAGTCPGPRLLLSSIQLQSTRESASPWPTTVFSSPRLLHAPSLAFAVSDSVLISSPSPSTTAARADARGPAGTGISALPRAGSRTHLPIPERSPPSRCGPRCSASGLGLRCAAPAKGSPPGRLPRAADLST